MASKLILYAKRKAEDLYMVTSLIRNTPLLRPYSRTIPRVLWWS